MRVQISTPTDKALIRHHERQREAQYNYTEVGATRHTFPEDYYCHRTRFYLGQGSACWDAAKVAIDHWEQFSPDWAKVYPKEPPQEGKPVVVWFNIFGLWWKNSARIVYVRDEVDQYGFAYGTLPDHVARGEEYFGIERDAEGHCHFVLEAFCTPVFWGARLLEPLMRREQSRFVQEAGARMQLLTGDAASVAS